MIKYLLVGLVAFQMINAHPMEYPEKHHEEPRALYDRVSIEIKEAHHFKTVLISALVASLICVTFIYYNTKKNPHDIIIRPIDNNGNPYAVSFRFD